MNHKPQRTFTPDEVREILEWGRRGEAMDTPQGQRWGCGRTQLRRTWAQYASDDDRQARTEAVEAKLKRPHPLNGKTAPAPLTDFGAHAFTDDPRAVAADRIGIWSSERR